MIITFCTAFADVLANAVQKVMIIDVMYCIALSDIPFRPGAGHRKTVAFDMRKKYNETVSRNQWAQQGVSHDRSPLECLVNGRNAAMAPVTGLLRRCS